LINNNLINQSLSFKKNATGKTLKVCSIQFKTVIYDEMETLYQKIKPNIKNKSLARQIQLTLWYGTFKFRIIEAGWRVMSYGSLKDRKIPIPENALQDAIADYDRAWAQYKSFGLVYQVK
jgi:hypothetical protein